MYTEGSGEREARCSRDGPYSPAFEAYVGDGDDRVRLESSVDPLIDGGEGNDELDASASGSNTPSMRGGGGDDRLVGSGRPDDDGDGWVGDFLEGGRARTSSRIPRARTASTAVRATTRSPAGSVPTLWADSMATIGSSVAGRVTSSSAATASIDTTG